MTNIRIMYCKKYYAIFKGENLMGIRKTFPEAWDFAKVLV